jgi:hypothetical protein
MDIPRMIGFTLILLILIVIAVEVAMWRRFREIKAMFATALNVGASLDGAVVSIRKAGEDTSARVTQLSGRVDQLDGEVRRLGLFHPLGHPLPKQEV